MSKFDVPKNPDDAIDMALEMMEEDGASFFLVVTKDHETKVMQMIQNTPTMDHMDVIAHLIDGMVEGAESLKKNMTKNFVDKLSGFGRRRRRTSDKDMKDIMDMFKIKPKEDE